MNILLIVGTAKDIFVYNMAKWLKKSMDVHIDVFEFYPSEQQQYDYQFYDNVTSVNPNTWFKRIRGVRTVLFPFYAAEQLDIFLSDKQYDIIQCHWLVPPLVLARSINTHCDRLYATFWGGEYNLLKICYSHRLYCYYLNKFLHQVDYIIGSEVYNDRIMKIFPQIAGKCITGNLGSSPLDCLYDLMKSETKENIKRQFNLPEDKLCILIGYSGKTAHQHLKVISHFIANKELQDKVHLFAPMTRGCTARYVQQVETQLELSGYTYTIIKDCFLSDMEVAKIRYATDITLQLSISDAFSASIIECLYAKTIVIYGDWLNYEFFLKSNAFQALPVKSIEDAFLQLDHIIANYDSYYNMVEENSKSGANYTWAVCIQNWVNAYQNKIERE